MNLHAPHLCRYLQRPEKGVRSSRTVGICGFELLNVGVIETELGSSAGTVNVLTTEQSLQPLYLCFLSFSPYSFPGGSL